MMISKKRRLSAAKAREILRDGTVHGKPLTDQQRRYMGWIAGGAKSGSRRRK